MRRTSFSNLERIAVNVERLGSESEPFDGELDQIVRAAASSHGRLSGYDNILGERTTFDVRSTNFREDLHSAASGSFARQRLMVCGLSLALTEAPDRALPDLCRHINAARFSFYVAESATALARAIRATTSPELLTVSEYYGEAGKPLSSPDEVVHVDLQDAPFPDATFDLAITSDVMEHVPDAERAEREIVRILRRGGSYVFTAPFNPAFTADEIWAEKTPSGDILYHRPPIYHEDPIRPEGALVFRVFSQPDLRRRFEEFGCEFESYRIWSKTLGIIGDNAWIHIVRKL